MIRPTVQENAARYADCIAACNAAAAAALKCAAACLEEQDVRKMARCIALDMDCAGIAQLAASYMLRNSEFATLVCEDCAEVCKWCKEECEHHDSEHCQECARACAACMEQCLKMTA
ncbi:four-helix bundle copper-binding protein [Cupriavidus necator]|uniref:Four-helix bundle copper-binding protein n=1 Tax=Cupriavidus necator TaxID=106590 RepID=A0A367PEH3_CUPNE|nr:four-helix bundle copper-binding protein [Cupriavidus necator]QQX87437.1 four-helix bundle copper-binding protein [Cupriavidus necator]RCJ05485.1 four-helix bundle copper-binding protein [Cupriavidus necator]